MSLRGVKRWNLEMETVSPPPSSSSSSVYLKFEFYLRNISWNADIENTHTHSTRQQLRRSHVASSHLKGEKSALSNTNMAKSPRHSRLTPPPLPFLARLANILARTCGPFRGEARGPRGVPGWDRGACEEDITRVHSANVSAGPSSPPPRSSEGMPLISRGPNGEQNSHPEVLLGRLSPPSRTYLGAEHTLPL